MSVCPQQLCFAGNRWAPASSRRLPASPVPSHFPMDVDADLGGSGECFGVSPSAFTSLLTHSLPLHVVCYRPKALPVFDNSQCAGDAACFLSLKVSRQLRC